MWLNKKRFFILAIILVIAAAGGLVAFRANQAQAQAEPPMISARISEGMLESQYGMHVNLVAVTGAGGFVDVRIKIMDGEKAKLLLGDAKNFPALLTGKDIVLDAPADTKSQEIRYEDGGTMFIMYPNSGNAVKHGEPVSILFGDVALDAINAQ